MSGGSPEIAANVARSVLSHDPLNVPAQVMLGTAMYALQLYPQSEAAYKAALAVQPNNAAAHLGLGRIRLAERDPKAAEEQFRHAAQQEPRADVFSNLGVALDMQQRPAEAQAAYRRSLELDPGSAATRSNLELSLHSAGGEPGARVVQQAPADRPGNGAQVSNYPSTQPAASGRSVVMPIVLTPNPLVLNGPE